MSATTLTRPVQSAPTVESAPAAPSCPRYPSLDLWRGVACLVVVVFHATRLEDRGLTAANALEHVILVFLSTLWSGVSLFFVISGYCIAATSDATRLRGHSKGAFFVRRVRRIFPPYWIFLAVSLTSVALLGWCGWSELLPERYRFDQLTALQWFGTWTLTGTWLNHTLGAGPYRMFWEHAWTLCYEEQFYLVCGLLLLFVPRRFFAGIVGVTLATLCLTPFSFKHVGLSLDGFFFDGNWLLFAAGVLLYYQRNYAGAGLKLAITLLFAIAALLAVLFRLVVLPRLVVGEGETMLASQLAFGACFALLLSLVQRWDGAIMASRWLRPLLWCGQRCYSLYLIHYPLTIVVSLGLWNLGVTSLVGTLFLTVPAALSVSVAGAGVFYWAVERHFLNPPVRRATVGLPEAQ